MESTLNAIKNSVDQKIDQPKGSQSNTPASVQSSSVNSHISNGLDNDSIDISTLEQRSRNPQRFLWSELIKSHLGTRCLTIMDTLIALGRLSIREIRDRNPSFSIKEIKLILVSLTQLRLIKCFDDILPGGKKTTYYSYDEDGIYPVVFWFNPERD